MRKAWVRYVDGIPQIALKLSIVRTTKNTNAAYNIFDVSWESPSNNVTNSNVIYWSSATATIKTTEKIAFGATSYRFEYRKNGSIPLCFSVSLVNEYGTTSSDSVCEDVALLPTTTTSSTTTSSTTTIPSAPNTPTDFKLVFTSPFDGTGKLTWLDKPGNANNFYISSIEPLKLESLDKAWYKSKDNKTSVGVKGFVKGGYYCYWILASNSLGKSAWSNSTCATEGVETKTTSSALPISPPVSTGSPSATSPASSGVWSGCYFKGIRMWGSVYITRNPAEANVTAYRTTNLYGSDLKVFNSPYSYSANSCGMWFNTKNPNAADFKVYFSAVQTEAEISVYMTPYANIAGR